MDAATTGAGRTVAAYCGPGGPVSIPYRQGAPATALYEGAVDKLGKGRASSPADLVLWRVSREDVDPLRHGGELAAATSRVELSPEGTISHDTFSGDHRIWVQLLGAPAMPAATTAAAGSTASPAIAATVDVVPVGVDANDGFVTRRDLAASLAASLAANSSLLLAQFKEMLTGEEGATFLTPADYEDAARPFLRDVVLPQWLGLLPVAGALLERAEGDASAFQWDFRAPVRLSTLPPSGPPTGSRIIVYPSYERYQRPSPPPVERHLTPTKVPGATAPPAADFMAVFEVTIASSWSSLNEGSLLWRLEQRLFVSLQRAMALQADGTAPLDITDVVAVVGVVGAFHCQQSVSTLMVRTDAPPLLRKLMQQARFVFVSRPYGDPSEGGRSPSRGGW